MAVRVEHFLNRIMSAESSTHSLVLQITDKSWWYYVRNMLLGKRVLIYKAPEGMYEYTSNRLSRNTPKVTFTPTAFDQRES